MGTPNGPSYMMQQSIVKETSTLYSNVTEATSVAMPTKSKTKTKSKTSRKKTKHYLLIISVVCLFSTVASIISILYVITFSRKEPRSVVYNDNQLCVPCRIIGDKKGAIKGESGSGDEQMCCFGSSEGKQPAGISQALESIKLEGGRGTRDNSFHVYYSEDSSPRRESLEKSAVLRSWATKGNRIHVGERIQHDDKEGLFTITTSGNYRIYSHMSFQPAPHVLIEHYEKGHNMTFLFSHKVNVKSPTAIEKDVIMEDGAEATCRIRRQYGGQLYPCHVSNLVSMMPLNKGDALSVEVAPQEFLLGELKSTYFGLFLIG